MPGRPGMYASRSVQGVRGPATTSLVTPSSSVLAAKLLVTETSQTRTDSSRARRVISA